VIDVIIVNYNCSTYLQTLLEILTKTDVDSPSRRVLLKITVVDNNSSDGSADMVKTQFPGVQVIEREENDGYSAAVNEGLASTEEREILLLNSDIEISPDIIAQIRRIWDRLDFPGIIAPLHFEEDDFPQLTWGDHPTPTAEAKRRKLDMAAADREPWAKQELLAQSCKTRTVDWVSGSCMFFTRSTAMDIGPWDQNFFLFFEDIDWCLRAKEKGFEIYHTSEAQIRHAHGVSVDQDPEMSEIEYRRSQCYFTQKHFGSFSLLKLRAYLTFKILGRWIIGGRSGFDRSTSWQIFRDVWGKMGA